MGKYDENVNMLEPEVESGVQAFTITRADVYVAKTGSTCIKLTLTTDEGINIQKYIVLADKDGNPPANKRSWRNFAKALGISAEDFEWGDTTPSPDGKTESFNKFLNTRVLGLVVTKPDQDGYPVSEIATFVQPEQE